MTRPGPEHAESIAADKATINLMGPLRLLLLCIIKLFAGYSQGRMRAGPPEAIHVRAADNLRFIRDTMSRAAELTAVPGWGGVVMGVTALATAALAGPPPDGLSSAGGSSWVAWWLGDAALAILIGLVAMARKAHQAGMPLGGASARRFALALVPALAAGAVLTRVLIDEHLTHRLPGLWLLLYGAAVTSGGALSVRVVPLFGAACMTLGVSAFVSPPTWGHLYLAAGFGALQIGFGIVIARRYGG
jgi:hypothetical protein